MEAMGMFLTFFSSNRYPLLQSFSIKSQSGIVQRLGYSAFNTFWVEAPERPGFGKIHHSTSIRNIVLTTSQIPGTGNITSHDVTFFLLYFWPPRRHSTFPDFVLSRCLSTPFYEVVFYFIFANTSASCTTNDTRSDD
jgi:hypothetical protein